MNSESLRSRKFAQWIEKNPIAVVITLIATVVGCIASCIAVFTFATGATSISALNRPPHQGTFLRVGRKYEEMPTVKHADAWIQPSMWPATDDKQPTIVFWQPTVDLQYLQLNEVVGGLGIGIDTTSHNGSIYPMVGYFTDYSAAEAAGLWVGDVIISVDGVDTTNMPVEQFRGYTIGPVGSPVSVVVQRGNEQLTFTALR